MSHRKHPRRRRGRKKKPTGVTTISALALPLAAAVAPGTPSAPPVATILARLHALNRAAHG